MGNFTKIAWSHLGAVPFVWFCTS